MTDPLVAVSRAAIARGSKSFALASRLFDPVTRDRATLLYAWCRYADDVIDGQVDGFGRVEGAGTPADRLAALEAGTRAALNFPRGSHAGAGQHPSPGETAGLGTGMHVDAGLRQHDSGTGEGVAFAALSRVFAETNLPARYPLDLIEGFRSDVDERRFASFDDTLTYCYHVAGCVGVMMAIVMGVDAGDAATLDRACDLGLAFQLDNIARDVIEDARNGRCYLPEAWLAAAGLSSVNNCHPRERGEPSPEAHRMVAGPVAADAKREMGSRVRGNDSNQSYFAHPHNRAALASVVARLVDEAERYTASSRYGTPALPWRSAWAVLAAADIYGGIGRRVRAEGVAALDRRVTTSTSEKLAAVARALPAALGRRRWASPPSRAGLWNRPRAEP